MATQERLAAAAAYTKALSTGDRGAADAAAPHLAQDIVVQVGNRTFDGYDEALEHITGIWPLTPVYRKGDWGRARRGERQRGRARRHAACRRRPVQGQPYVRLQ